MAVSLPNLIDQLFLAVQTKDLPGVLACFADDAILIDPHYPTPRMVGKQAISEGVRWAFATLDQMHFTPVNYFAAEDGQRAAVEVATAHVVRGGRQLRFVQTFVIETQASRITRLQVYTPYGPPGLGGLLLGLLRLQRRWSRRR